METILAKPETKNAALLKAENIIRMISAALHATSTGSGDYLELKAALIDAKFALAQLKRQAVVYV